MRTIFFLLMLLSGLGLTMGACSPDNTSDSPVIPDSDPDLQPGKGRYLVVYFSRSGNTRSVATEIREQLDGTLTEIVPTVSYPSDYNATLSRARQEISAIDNDGTYPSIRTVIESFDNYNVVFICTPLWHARMSAPVQSFLHECSTKFGGKRLALVVTSSSTGISSVVADGNRLCPGSTFTGDALWVRASQAGNAHDMVAEWLKTLDLSAQNPGKPEENVPETVSVVNLKNNVTR